MMMAPNQHIRLEILAPAGGIVFYTRFDSRSSIDSDKLSPVPWNYIEVLTYDLPESQWGCANTSIENAQGLELGAGDYNTYTIVAFHDALNDFYNNPTDCHEASNGTVAAKVCADLVVNGFDDWVLPSKEEMDYIYQNVHLQGDGNFNLNALYWTSTEHDYSTAYAMDFNTGGQGYMCKPCHETTRIRAIRYF